MLDGAVSRVQYLPTSRCEPWLVIKCRMFRGVISAVISSIKHNLYSVLLQALLEVDLHYSTHASEFRDALWLDIGIHPLPAFASSNTSVERIISF